MSQAEIHFTQDHEWVRLEEDTAVIGITSFATEELGEIVYVELPTVENQLTQGQEFGVVESVKTVSSLFSPVTGTVEEINQTLQDAPNMLNDDPYENGWMLKVKMSDTTEIGDLMTQSEYDTFLSTQ